MAAWLVMTADRGVIRREPTRRAAVAWMKNLGGGKVLFRRCYGPGSYEYHVGDAEDGERVAGYFVDREERVKAVGFWALELPDEYPYPDRPYAQDPEVDRETLLAELERRRFAKQQA